ncbi:bifunctional N-acetylglucosamine-1-phosphate uridyltransferase/glucosamine-1-phosphate acetyltransferase [Candidatus Bipolaricaulota bacterium]|nr:bifunctional N-acetylglucosamine-1-phosphate uridyltransferase/glucosamine-1-phosphate acetyltransferase [Candidatus Bipolaricaulota bacterium]
MDSVILAAGKGTRMASDRPKVLHEIRGKPLIQHLLDSLAEVLTGRIIVVVGYKADLVSEELSGQDIQFVLQEEQKGTAHALQQAKSEIKSDKFLVFPGDLPLIKPESIQEFVDASERKGVDFSLFTTEREDPAGYGRVKRGRDGKVVEIVEEQDASDKEKEIKEINTGVYLISNREYLWQDLDSIDPENAQNEFYLTDLVKRASGKGREVAAVSSNSPNEFLGVNTREDLARAGQILNDRKIKSLMEKGVTVVCPDETIVEPEVTVARDTHIRPFSILRGETKIGAGSDIGPNTEVIDSKIGDGVDLSHSVIREASIQDGRKMEPFQKIGPEV